MASEVDILNVVTDDDRRGAQVFAVDLQHALECRGRTTRTVALGRGRTGGLGVEVLGDQRRSAASLHGLRRAAKAAGVVVAHGSTTLPACALALTGTSVPFVYRQISDVRFWVSTPTRRMRTRAAMSRAAAVVALWSGAAETVHAYLGVPQRKITVVPNGVPASRFSPAGPAARTAARRALGVDPDRFTVVTVSALVPEKGIDLAVRAVSRLPGAQLVIAGDGSDAESLRRLAQQLASGRVHFCGSVDDVVRVLRAADVFALPSLGGDSMPAALIEAGLTGVPLVSTPIEAIPDIVVDGRTGILVAPGDEDDLESALLELLQDGGRAAELGNAARAHCLERFSIDVVAARWDSVLESVERGS